MQDVGQRVFRLAIGANSTAERMQQMEEALQEIIKLLKSSHG
jgi:hypothetical protein